MLISSYSGQLKDFFQDFSVHLKITALNVIMDAMTHVSELLMQGKGILELALPFTFPGGFLGTFLTLPGNFVECLCIPVYF